MKKETRTVVLSAIAAALCGIAVTGCGQARTGTESSEQSSEPAVTVVTEAPIVIQTEAPQTETEAPAPVVTEAPETQAQTQAETQPQTQAETAAPVVLTADEELAQENVYTDWVTMYANSDINVRNEPSSDGGDDTIITSYTKGDEVTVTGDTPNWFRVTGFTIYNDDGTEVVSDLTGYVRKEYISSTYEDAMSDDPVGSAPAQTVQETAAPEETAAADQQETSAEADDAAQADAQTAETTAQTAASSASGPTVTVNTDANIRSDAYETASVVGVVNAGTTVTQIGSADGWVQIDYNGVQGYINANFVS